MILIIFNISSSRYRLCWWTLLQLWDHQSDLKMMIVMDASSTKHQVSSFPTLFFNEFLLVFIEFFLTEC